MSVYEESRQVMCPRCRAGFVYMSEHMIEVSRLWLVPDEAGERAGVKAYSDGVYPDEAKPGLVFACSSPSCDWEDTMREDEDMEGAVKRIVKGGKA